MTNTTGQVISWASAGKMGFKGSKKNTPYAAQMAAQDCATKAFEQGFAKLKYSLKDLVLVVNQRSVPSRDLVLKLLQSAMLHRFLTTVAVLLRKEEFN